MTDAEMQKTVRDVTNAIEDAWTTLRRSTRDVSLLYAQGAATCDDVKTYNLLALSIYESQKAMLEFFRGQGVEGLPSAPPSPTLFAWKGTPGSQAAILDCSKQLQGPTGLGAMPLPKDSLQILTSEPNYMDPQIKRVELPSAQLGAVPLVIYVVVCGVAFACGVAIGYMFVRAIETISGQKRQMLETKQKTETAARFWQARNACMTTCTTTASTESCFDKCQKLIPFVDVSPTPENRWGIWSLLGIGAIGLVVGVIAYRKLTGQPLPGASAFRGLDDVDEDDDDDDEIVEEDVEVLSAPNAATFRAKSVA